MSTPAQVTEEHIYTTAKVGKAYIAGEDAQAAQLIADSEARACDQLRAEVEQWELAFQEQYARAERAEAELATAKAIIASIEEDGTEEHNAAVRLRQELAAERARLDWLMAGGVCMVQHSGGFYVSRLHAQVSRAVIDSAMKEETK